MEESHDRRSTRQTVSLEILKAAIAAGVHPAELLRDDLIHRLSAAVLEPRPKPPADTASTA